MCGYEYEKIDLEAEETRSNSKANAIVELIAGRLLKKRISREEKSYNTIPLH